MSRTCPVCQRNSRALHDPYCSAACYRIDTAFGEITTAALVDDDQAPRRHHVHTSIGTGCYKTENLQNNDD